MSGSRKKYVYIRTPNGRYVKARVMLEGRDEPTVTPTMEGGKVIIVGKPSTKVPYGYKIVEFEDLPPEVRSKIEFL